jgi:hypothetical protein
MTRKLRADDADRLLVVDPATTILTLFVVIIFALLFAVVRRSGTTIKISLRIAEFTGNCAVNVRKAAKRDTAEKKEWLMEATTPPDRKVAG